MYFLYFYITGHLITVFFFICLLPSADVYNTFVEDIMVKELTYIWYSITYTELKKLLKENRRIKFFPLVDGHSEYFFY